MTTAEITNAFVNAHLSLVHGAPIGPNDHAVFTKALGAIRILPAAERIAIAAEIKATVAACVGKAA